MQTLYGGKTQVNNYYFTEKKPLRIINNQPMISHSGLLFNKSNILKCEGKILIINKIFISESIDKLLLPILKNWFIFFTKIHNYATVSFTTVKLFLSLPIKLTPMVKTPSF